MDENWRYHLTLAIEIHFITVGTTAKSIANRWDDIFIEAEKMQDECDVCNNEKGH